MGSLLPHEQAAVQDEGKAQSLQLSAATEGHLFQEMIVVARQLAYNSKSCQPHGQAT